MKKNGVSLLLVLILLGAFIVRLYRFDSPIADWHAWRQVDTSAVSRNFVEHGFDILHPRYDDISNVQTGQNNPNGYRFVEFPLYNIVQAVLFQYLGILTLEQWGRMVTIISSVLTCLFLYLLVAKYSNKVTGLLSAFFYAFIPFSIYYGRTVLADTTTIMATFGAIYFFDKWIEEEKTKKPRHFLFFIVALLFALAAPLLKPYALFFFLPMAYSAWGAYKQQIVKKWLLYVFAVIIIAPLIAWRLWMQNFPEGIPANQWLLNGNGIRFRPSFFRWMVYERLTKLILGYIGLVPFFVGAYAVFQLKHKLFFLSFALSSALYVCVFATGNVQHDYYQILIFPSIAMFLGIGTMFLFQLMKRYTTTGIAYVVIALCIVGTFYLSWDIVKDYFNINNRVMLQAAKIVDEKTPRDALVIAEYQGDTTFLYHTKRKGWPSFQASIPDMIVLGAEYLILLYPKPQDYDLGKTYKVVAQTNEYILLDLQSKP